MTTGRGGAKVVGVGKDLRLFLPPGAPHEVEEASPTQPLPSKMADNPAHALLQSCGSPSSHPIFYKVHDALSVLSGYLSMYILTQASSRRSASGQQTRRRRRRLRKAPPTGFSGGRAARREVTAVGESFDVGRLQMVCNPTIAVSVLPYSVPREREGGNVV
ncbi:hypothetical protein BDP81DRAFT_192177 [Colletotrichum phormii]|uniref:Uncharacterized protein n=1 Tax=Colletotrichum phormii TaxID=359342 RepID=A0AAJ0EH42_9PEZI|nr:uncharacterized protein BDP81DRAFT_192177 [Colletotrichum phormii]KAK1638828.1 hypothetical protein BDP81DRAFT_192177 [Colletotrichum phormii]